MVVPKLGCVATGSASASVDGEIVFPGTSLYQMGLEPA